MSNKKLLSIAIGLLLVAGIAGGGGSAVESGSSNSADNAAQSEQSSQYCYSSDEQDSYGSSSSASESSSSSYSSYSSSSSSASSNDESENVGKNSSFKVTFFDIGQGDCALVQCNGHNMLIDGGPQPASSTLYSYFSRKKIKKLDYVIATHADTDHTGGISGALQVAKAKHAYCSVTSSYQQTFNSMKKILKSQGVSIKVPACGSSFKLGKAKVYVIGPENITDNGDNNDDSIMLKITYGKTVFVFTGDANYDEEKSACKYLDGCDVLKVAHHGSASSSSYQFLRAAMPKNAIISVGAGNTYGHPKEKALSRLKDCGAKIYRTDLQGDIVVTSNGKKVKISVSKNKNANTLQPGK